MISRNVERDRRPEVDEFVAYLAKERNDSPNTVEAYQRDVSTFAEFCDEYYGGRWEWRLVDRLGVRSFMGELQRRGQAKRSVARALSALRTFYNFMMLRHGIALNPARAVRTPRLEKRLPGVLDRSQIDQLFANGGALAGGGGFSGTRDLAILELFYGTGMRLSELAGLNLSDVDLVSDQVKVKGKGRKERILPLGGHAVRAVRKYYATREKLVTAVGGQKTDGRAVFLSARGKRLSS
ncbi:MAG: site-specific integrase, partial [Thermoanaerobaculia bacterium]